MDRPTIDVACTNNGYVTVVMTHRTCTPSSPTNHWRGVAICTGFSLYSSTSVFSLPPRATCHVRPRERDPLCGLKSTYTLLFFFLRSLRRNFKVKKLFEIAKQLFLSVQRRQYWPDLSPIWRRMEWLRRILHERGGLYLTEIFQLCLWGNDAIKISH